MNQTLITLLYDLRFCFSCYCLLSHFVKTYQQLLSLLWVTGMVEYAMVAITFTIPITELFVVKKSKIIMTILLCLSVCQLRYVRKNKLRWKTSLYAIGKYNCLYD